VGFDMRRRYRNANGKTRALSRRIAFAAGPRLKYPRTRPFRGKRSARPQRTARTVRQL
jgi:hypothetical protein